MTRSRTSGPPEVIARNRLPATDERSQLLRSHIDDNAPLASIAEEAGRSVRTIQRWMRRYREFGSVGLARQGRADRGTRRRLSEELCELAERLARQGPPSLGPTAIYRELCQVAEARGYTQPRFSTIYSFIRATREAGKSAAATSNSRTASDGAPDRPPNEHRRPVAELSFEEALAELETIVRQLEGGKVSLEYAIKAYERGSLLRAHCERNLKDAQASVDHI